MSYIFSKREKARRICSNAVADMIDYELVNEKEIIEIGYELFTDKLEDIKILNDELKRVSLELANLKAYSDDNEYGGDDNNDEDEEGYE